MAGTAKVRDPWSAGDLNVRPADPLQFRRNTTAGLVAQNPLLAPGEPAWEIDGQQGKIGNGTTRYVSLPYTLGGSASSLGLPAGTIAGNNTTSTGPASGLDPLAARNLLEVPWESDFADLEGAYTAHAGAVHTPTLVTHAATSNAATSTVTASGGVAFPVHFSNGVPVYGPGVRPYTYIQGMAANRLTFTLSSNAISTVAVNADAGGAGSGSFSVRDLYNTAHGVNLHGLPEINPLSQVWTGRSGSIQLPAGAPPAERYYSGWYKGEYWMKSAEYPTAERIFPAEAFAPILKHIMIPAIGTYHTWSPFPTATPASFSGHYINWIPLEGATQAKLVVTWQGSTATSGSGAKIKAQYHNGTTFVDLAENSPASLIQVALDDGGLQPKEGAWGNIDNAALTAAAAAGDRLIIRIAGFATTAAGSPTFSQIELWTRP